MRASLLLVIIIAFSIVSAQEDIGEKMRKNEIATDLAIFSSPLKTNYGFQLETAGLLISYRRLLLQSRVLSLRGEFGLGVKYPTGESSFFLIPYNLYIKTYIGKSVHSFISGLGIMGFDGLSFVLPIGYSYQFSPGTAFNLSFNTVLWEHKVDFDKSYYGWVWENSNIKQFVQFGFSYGF
ncbi:MAG: hypothetical protein GXO89_14615 [Chlorobi bacterium]|nr:hypothetical protein [Chlorobiota bacterium]